jgi:hypothetical protein
MATKDSDTISITLKNGQCFEHHPPKESFDKQLEFLNETLDGLLRESGILMLSYPVALYRNEDISSIHFPDIVQSASTPPMGFRTSKAEG